MTELVALFRQTYHYGTPVPSRISLKSFNLENVGEGGRRELTADLIWDNTELHCKGEGSGALSAVLVMLNSQIEGTLSIKEYAEHSIGEGSDVQAASYVELAYDLQGKRSTAWGVSSDTDITASGLKAVLRAASALGVTPRKLVNGH